MAHHASRKTPPAKRQSSALIFQSIVVAQKYEAGTPARAATDRSHRGSQRILGIVATCICVPNLVIMWLMKNIKLDEEDLKDEQGVDRAIAKIEKRMYDR
ncbi:hypothetical protein TPAR_03944 [Tolypocladium paradoxum]|uniref:Uncharacterized protein n=1 Tax=Tolypocladium paradoxum TaxID=94208 RepID=A0A2S4L087_9HYPO|nr:hypothetical protein TPAR_03944 [Tolypocladium paradoxum]